jgi:tripeptidyl-peptidase I
VDDDIYEPEEVATTNVFNTFLDALDGSYCTYTSNGETGDDPKFDAVYPHNVPGGYMGQLECGVYTPTKVISASYGQAEADLPSPYVLRQCNEFMKLGLQGISILFSSGDYGVASFPNDIGTTGNTGCLGPEGVIFNPQYPSGCPYVTSVGGTQLNNTVAGGPAFNASILNPETVMYDHLRNAFNFSSSGGFSNYFPRPTYQDGHVETYFHRAHLTYPYYTELNVDVSTTTGLYSRNGRAYPDVSAFGAYFPSFIGGRLTHFFGASLSSPIFASVLTLVRFV